MTNSKKIWLLDFDDVVNGNPSTQELWPGLWRYATVEVPSLRHPLPVWYSQVVVDLIASAVDRGIDVRWLSTWCGHTQLLPAAMRGLPELPWIDFKRWSSSAGYYKARAAVDYCGDEADVLWTEDEGSVTDGMVATEWRQGRSGPVTVINPLGPGLTPGHVEQIEEWILR